MSSHRTDVPLDRLDRLAAWVAETTIDDLPAEAIEKVKLQFLDHMGSAVLGADVLGSDILADTADRFGAASEATVILSDRRTTAFAASLVNAAFISQTELTVGIGRAITHPGTQGVAVALAEGERSGASGADILVSLIAAYEVGIRLGWSLTHVPSEPLSSVRPQLTLRGWYAPSLLGKLAAAAAAARLRGLDAQQTLNAFGICGNLSPTTVHAGAREGMIKGLGEGWAAALGLFAVDLAERGFTGVPNVAGHLFPLLVDGADHVDFERIDAGLGERLEFLDFGGNQTMFNASRTSSITDCALQLVDANTIDPARIADVKVETMRRFRSLDDRAPDNELGAKFSIPYVVAQVLVGRSRDDLLDVAFTREAFADPHWRPIAELVRVEVDPIFDAEFETYPRTSSSSRITVTLTDGTEVSQRVTGAFGMLGGTPATAADFARKFRILADARLPEGNADAMVELIETFEKQPDVHELMRLCARRRPTNEGGGIDGDR